MKYTIKTTLLILLIAVLGTTATAQVDFYFYHMPSQKNVKPYEAGTGYLYNRTDYIIDVKLETKVFDENEELVYHILTDTKSIISGKTIISHDYYKNATPIVNKIDRSKPLLNHRIETKILHPQDLSSIIAMYDIFTKNYTHSTDPKDRYNYFYIIPTEIEINSRNGDFFEEGTKLTHVVKMPPKAGKKNSRDFSIDLSRSKLLSMKDNTGKEYLTEEFILMMDRREYVREKARNGTFMGSSIQDEGKKHLDKPFMPNRDEIATFFTRTFSTPTMATNITSEGYITIIQHTDELVKKTIEVDLYNGQRTVIDGNRIDWTINGGGSCGEGSYDIMSPHSALKFESIKILNPMIDICQDNSSRAKSIPIDKDKLPYKAQLEIVYKKSVAKEVYFKNNFNLNLYGTSVEIATDHNTEASIAKLVVSAKKDEPKISATFLVGEPTPERRINPSLSTVTVKDEQGKSAELGKVNIKDDYFFANDKFTVEIESSPSRNTRFLTAEVKLAFDKQEEGTDEFVIEIQHDKDADVQIDNYLMTFTKRQQGANAQYTLIIKGSNYCCGMPGRSIIGQKVFDDKGEEIEQTDSYGSFVIPEDNKTYKVVLTLQKKSTYYETVTKKIAIGAMERN